MSEAVELERDLFALLCKKYVQRSDERQTAMGLQYTTAETRDLARTIARFLTLRAKPEGEPVAWPDREAVARIIDPNAWDDGVWAEPGGVSQSWCKNQALAKADAILALPQAGEVK